VQVRAKKSLGQHFLKDLDAAKRIVDGLQPNGAYNKVLEIGPGMGVLTQFLVKKTEYQTSLIEIDQESVAYLRKNYLEFTGPSSLRGVNRGRQSARSCRSAGQRCTCDGGEEP